MTEDGPRWQGVHQDDGSDSCRHERRYQSERLGPMVCLVCGADVEPPRAPVLDLEAARRRRAARRR